MKVKAFVSFDYDNDKELKENIISQSGLPDSPFRITDLSIGEAIDEKWKNKAREKIRMCDIVIFICGEHTDVAKGVTAEMSITREERKPYLLLRGRKQGNVKKPKGALSTDEIHKWVWKDLKTSISELIRT